MTGPDPDRFGSRRSTVHAPSGMVATSQPLAARTGLSVLEDGGNAFDAAVATAATLNVVEPTSTGLGGDVFALYRDADGEVGAMRSCGGAPADATLERVRDSVTDPGEDPAEAEMPLRGPHAVTVPGTARGWELTLEELGTRTLEEVLQPAIRYATDGFPVSTVVSSQWAHGEEIFETEHARAAYLVDGERAPTPGETVRLPRLGESLRKVADRGADVVYEGEIAEAIAAEVQEAGGFLTVEDLAGFEPEFVDPVTTTYGGCEVYELPPNNQGPIALEALNVAEELGAGDYDPGDPEGIHRYVEALKIAFHDGHHYLTDPEYEDVPDLTTKAYASERAETIGDRASEDRSVGVPGTNAEDADTVLLTVADDEGNVVSFINSRFAGFGSGLVAGDTGIALQNRGSSFSLDPDHPNHLEPGKRPFHTLIPAVARFGPDDWAAFGVMGGYMQPQGHLQVIANVVDHGMSLQRALDHPRWRYREDGTLAVEERYGEVVGTSVATKLARKGHDVRVLPPTSFGGAQIVRSRGGSLSGASEPRKDGQAVGY
jgi:gamma-glutamyltranspeptidase/glutathione hydrolase